MNYRQRPWEKKQRSQDHTFISRFGTRTQVSWRLAWTCSAVLSFMAECFICVWHRGPTWHLWMHQKPSCCLCFCSEYSAGFWWLPMRPCVIGKEKANNKVAWWNAARSLARAFQYPAGIWVSRYTKACLFGRIIQFCVFKMHLHLSSDHTVQTHLTLVIEIKAYSGNFCLKLSLKILRKVSCWSPTQPNFPSALGLIALSLLSTRRSIWLLTGGHAEYKMDVFKQQN